MQQETYTIFYILEELLIYICTRFCLFRILTILKFGWCDVLSLRAEHESAGKRVKNEMHIVGHET